ncbi:hypothetical protein TREMEDRAFT_23720, partial [Tremella mesenterica DSM 1558]|uniref:uncharacterized protein n=1 Tax=Tremella mesenterica (strain ATCC 24925 / CBS 8224 / DSM 1558 / NBRC 9311 / NRRL Y-6157 / RJB 2259-6 / UBC 559-6) TaxID=578456 RepID=UPI0003F49E3B
SQWFPSSFTDPQFPEITFKTSEHYMMFQKSLMFDPSLCQQIIQSDHPAETKRLGRKIKNFNKEKWDQINVGIVSKGNYLKFKQDDRLRKVLIDTGKARLVEASPTDRIWGIGFGMKEALKNKDNWGDNKLGVALERARRRL